MTSKEDEDSATASAGRQWKRPPSSSTKSASGRRWSSCAGCCRAIPRNAYAYYFLGIALFEVGEIEPARDAYMACLKLAPSHLGARVALVHVLRMTGDTRGAIREGLAALSQAPGDPDALHAVGLAYHARGDEAAAIKYLEAFLETNPELEVGLETRAIVSALRGEPEETDPDD